MYELVSNIIMLPINWFGYLKDLFTWVVGNGYLDDIVKTCGIFIALGVFGLIIECLKAPCYFRKRGK